jgi:hypothetical protein
MHSNYAPFQKKNNNNENKKYLLHFFKQLYINLVEGVINIYFIVFIYELD